MMGRIFPVAACSILLFAGCKGDVKETTPQPAGKAREAAFEKALENVDKAPEEIARAKAADVKEPFVHPVKAKTPPVARNFAGRVTETMDASGYTYVHLESGDVDVWLAGPKAVVAVGDFVTSDKGALMKDFASLTLKRTFPTIYFVEKLTVSEDGGEPADAPDETALPHVATFNAGLARNYVPYVDERLPAIIEELVALDAEVVCLQEVWEKRDIKAIAKGVKKTFPHNFRLDTADSIFARDATEPACTEPKLAPLAECIKANCATAADTTGCVMKQCGTHFLSLPTGCRTCLAANVAKPLPEVVATCTTKGAGMSYDGANGLLMLSRRPLERTHYRIFDSFLLQRVALHAVAETKDGKFNVFCTHLATPVAEVEYAGPYKSWADENKAQVEQLIRFVKETTQRFPAVVLGDLNCGPARPDREVAAELPDHFQLLVAAGFTNPYAAHEGRCTFCGIEELGAAGEGKLIDHALFLNVGNTGMTAQRIMERRIEVDGKKVPLSDHYGLRVGFELPDML